MKLNKNSIKFYTPILVDNISDDYFLYCDGQIYLEKNVAIEFPIILDNRYNIVFADFNKVGIINENIISICEAYSRLTNSDSKTISLDIVRISIENSQNHSFLIFELTDYRLTGMTNGYEHHFTQYYYQVDLVNGEVRLRNREEGLEFSCE